jgi:hypothetical protein
LEYPRLFSRRRGYVGWRAALVLLVIGSIVEGVPVHAETHYIPAVNLSQRYDSNPFYAPKEFLPPETQQWDFVTTLSTGLKVLNKSRVGDTEFQGFVNGNVYAYNTSLSYASTYLNATSDVTNWVRELLPGATLRLSDVFQYTPEPPAFLTGGKIAETDVFARGIQGYRANTFYNNLSADGGYSISRSVGLKTSYTYSIRRTGSFFVPGTPFTFFNTTTHNVAVGPTYAFENGDTLFMKYNYITSDQVPTTAGVSSPFTFNAHALQPEYVTTIVRGWQATISGGATLVEEAQNKTFFSGRFALSNEFDRRTRASISVSRQAAPAYFGTGGALISNVAQIYLSHNLSRVVRLTVSGNYAHNETTTGPLFKIETTYGSAVLDYKLTPGTKVSLLQEYGTYNITNSPNFDRYATTLTLTTEWK